MSLCGYFTKYMKLYINNIDKLFMVDFMLYITYYIKTIDYLYFLRFIVEVEIQLPLTSYSHSSHPFALCPLSGLTFL